MPGESGAMPPERRRLLVETAAREFAAAGYEQASLNRIIRSCGLSKSSFYHYVRSKQDLFELVVTDIGRELVAAVTPPAPAELAGPDFWAQVGRLLDRLVLASRERRFTDLGRLCYLPGAPADADSAPARALAAAEAWLHEALAVGRACGAVRDDLPPALQSLLTVAVLRTFDEWTLHHHDELDPAERERIPHAELDALRRLLAPGR